MKPLINNDTRYSMNTRKEVRKGRARNRTLLFQAGRRNDKKHSKKRKNASQNKRDSKVKGSKSMKKNSRDFMMSPITQKLINQNDLPDETVLSRTWISCTVVGSICMITASFNYRFPLENVTFYASIGNVSLSRPADSHM